MNAHNAASRLRRTQGDVVGERPIAARLRLQSVARATFEGDERMESDVPDRSGATQTTAGGSLAQLARLRSWKAKRLAACAATWQPHRVDLGR